MTPSRNLALLGNLAPDPTLILRTQAEDYRLNDFAQGAEPPQAFIDLLGANQLAILEPCGVLLTSAQGIPSHTDEHLSAVWLLRGRAPVHQLIVAGQPLDLTLGDVALFNACRPHAFLTNEPGEWSLFTIYVKRQTVRAPARTPNH